MKRRLAVTIVGCAIAVVGAGLWREVRYSHSRKYYENARSGRFRPLPKDPGIRCLVEGLYPHQVIPGENVVIAEDRSYVVIPGVMHSMWVEKFSIEISPELLGRTLTLPAPGVFVAATRGWVGAAGECGDEIATSTTGTLRIDARASAHVAVAMNLLIKMRKLDGSKSEEAMHKQTSFVAKLAPLPKWGTRE